MSAEVMRKASSSSSTSNSQKHCERQGRAGSWELAWHRMYGHGRWVLVIDVHIQAFGSWERWLVLDPARTLSIDSPQHLSFRDADSSSAGAAARVSAAIRARARPSTDRPLRLAG